MGPSYLTLNKAIIGNHSGGCTLCSRTVIKSCDCSVWWGSLGSADYICKPQSHLIAFSFCPLCVRVHSRRLRNVLGFCNKVPDTKVEDVILCCLFGAITFDRRVWSNGGMKTNRETDGNLERILLQWHFFLQNLTNKQQILNPEPQASGQESTASSLIYEYGTAHG
jgi:hypothetical protein